MEYIKIILNQDTYTEELPYSESWDRYNSNTGGGFSQGDIILKKIAENPKWRIGAGIYHFIKTGKVISFNKVDKLDHYIKLAKSWLLEVHHTEPIFDEDDNENGTIDITNDAYFNCSKIANNTSVLVKITNEHFVELYNLIDFRTIGNHANIAYNMVCNDKFTDAISEGGDFYTAPEENPQT